MEKLKKYKYWLIITALAVFWRFWDFDNRWVFNQDQARDVIIGLYSIRNNVWPEIGSPSSAGPFNFGPWYHWIIILGEKIIPTVNGVWMLFGILSVVTVYLYFLTGGMVAGVIASMATGAVLNSPDMLNTVIVGFSSALMWWATKNFVETNKFKWGVLVGVGVGLSINFHFQSLGLLAIPLAIVLVNKFNIKKRLTMGISMLIGLLITFLPLIIFDIRRNGIWIKSVIEYYTVGVNKFYTPVRWLTEIRDFWPQLFGSTTVGVNNFGYVWLILGIILIIKKIKLNKFMGVVFLTLIIEILLMRNYKGTRSREYMIAFEGIIILISSWITTEYFKLNKYFGLIILGVFVTLAGINNWQNIYKYPSQAKDVLEIKRELDGVVLGKVRIMQYQQSDMVSLPIFYLYYRENRIDTNGTMISFCDSNRYLCPKGEIILKNNYRVYNADLKWDELTPKNIFDRLMVNYEK